LRAKLAIEAIKIPEEFKKAYYRTAQIAGEERQLPKATPLKSRVCWNPCIPQNITKLKPCVRNVRLIDPETS